jgi:glycosyltransferase involved in cell wall biosynthesis
MADLSPKQRLRIKVVFSSGGFDDLPEPAERTENDPLQVGYVGTLNFAKLHPQLLDFVAAVNLPSFRLALVGDPIPSSELLAGAAARGLSDRLDIRGYTMDVVAELTKFNVFAYLLNPLHYGTTENALLEAMAMGVVPIVLDNLAERHLVSHGETGLVVDSPRTFARALTYLSEYPNARKRLSLNASRDVRERFSVRRTAVHLETHYREILGEAKKSFDFRPVFGERPSDWFRACQGEQAWRFKDDDDPSDQERKNGENPHYLYAKTKGSVFHYRSIYPDDERLQRWSRRLEAAR